MILICNTDLPEKEYQYQLKSIFNYISSLLIFYELALKIQQSKKVTW